MRGSLILQSLLSPRMQRGSRVSTLGPSWARCRFGCCTVGLLLQQSRWEGAKVKALCCGREGAAGLV